MVHMYREVRGGGDVVVHVYQEERNMLRDLSREHFEDCIRRAEGDDDRLEQLLFEANAYGTNSSEAMAWRELRRSQVSGWKGAGGTGRAIFASSQSQL